MDWDEVYALFVVFMHHFVMLFFHVPVFPHDNAMLGCCIPASVGFAVANSNQLLDSMPVGEFGLSVRYVRVA